MDFFELEEKAAGVELGPKAPTYTLAVLGTHATQYLNKALGLQAKVSGINLEVYEADYDSIDMEIIDETSGLYESNPNAVFISYSTRKLSTLFYGLSEEEKDIFYLTFCERISNFVEILRSRLKANILIGNLEAYNDNVFGNFSSKTRRSFSNQIKRINVGLMDIAEEVNNVFVVDVNSLYAEKGHDYAFSPALYVNVDLAYTLDFTIDIAAEVIRIISAFTGSFKKCLILDLDNTVWGGIIGDDGLSNIEIGALGVGKAFTKLQHWAKQLKERGIILAVCSKNTESIAKEPFEKHPEMVLKLDDISVFVANWDNKVNNIRLIQEVLNIGFDSMVFIDDNPAEREIVRQHLPQVCVPELPEDPAEYLDYLTSLNLFETVSYSANDSARTQQYKEEFSRVQLRSTLSDIGEYLESLNMKADIRPFQPVDFARLAQLSQRSNQFNLRTVRYTEQDIENISKDASYVTFSVNLNDKFGDYGLVSIVVGQKRNEEELFIENWIMSCRVLKRDLEQHVLNKIVEAAKARGFKKVVGEYVPTAKNKLVEDHYSKLKFKPLDAEWHLDVDNFEYFKTKIK